MENQNATNGSSSAVPYSYKFLQSGEKTVDSVKKTLDSELAFFAALVLDHYKNTQIQTYASFPTVGGFNVRGFTRFITGGANTIFTYSGLAGYPETAAKTGKKVDKIFVDRLHSHLQELASAAAELHENAKDESVSRDLIKNLDACCKGLKKYVETNKAEQAKQDSTKPAPTEPEIFHENYKSVKKDIAEITCIKEKISSSLPKTQEQEQIASKFKQTESLITNQYCDPSGKKISLEDFLMNANYDNEQLSALFDQAVEIFTSLKKQFKSMPPQEAHSSGRELLRQLSEIHANAFLIKNKYETLEGGFHDAVNSLALFIIKPSLNLTGGDGNSTRSIFINKQQKFLDEAVDKEFKNYCQGSSSEMSDAQGLFREFFQKNTDILETLSILPAELIPMKKECLMGKEVAAFNSLIAVLQKSFTSSSAPKDKMASLEAALGRAKSLRDEFNAKRQTVRGAVKNGLEQVFSSGKISKLGIFFYQNYDALIALENEFDKHGKYEMSSTMHEIRKKLINPQAEESVVESMRSLFDMMNPSLNFATPVGSIQTAFEMLVLGQVRFSDGRVNPNIVLSINVEKK